MNYSRTPVYEHPLDTDTSSLWTVQVFVTGRRPYIFSKYNPPGADS